jgi:hypothetical protein
MVRLAHRLHGSATNLSQWPDILAPCGTPPCFLCHRRAPTGRVWDPVFWGLNCWLSPSSFRVLIGASPRLSDYLPFTECSRLSMITQIKQIECFSVIRWFTSSGRVQINHQRAKNQGSRHIQHTRIKPRSFLLLLLEQRSCFLFL